MRGGKTCRDCGLGSIVRAEAVLDSEGAVLGMLTRGCVVTTSIGNDSEQNCLHAFAELEQNLKLKNVCYYL